MVHKKAFLFIDGSNVYHSLKTNELYYLFTFEWLFEELSKRFEIEKVFYYDAVKNINIEPEQYAKQQKFHERLRKQISSIKIRQRKLKYINTEKKLEEAKKISNFCDSCKQKMGSFLKNSGLHKLSREKGVDVMLVTDMIRAAYQNKYEVALIFTGDADFVPAVELVQFLGKEVVNIHCYAGSSGELRTKCDSHLLIDSMNSNCVLR